VEEAITITCSEPRGENDLPRPTVTDDCSDANEITLTFVDDESGLADCGDSGVFTRTWTATDACGLTATCVQTITITNEAPVLNCDNLDQTISCADPRGENDLPRPTVTDDCSDANEITLTFVDDESGLDDCGDQGTILRTWTATDACGLTSTCIQTITITNEAPTLVCDNLDVTVSCNESTDTGLLPSPTVTDDCTPTNNITLTSTDDNTNVSECGSEGFILRTWTATDACGLTSTCIQTITITNEAPVLVCANLDITIECDADINPDNNAGLPTPTVTDDCTPVGEIDLTYVDADQGTPECNGNRRTILRTWTATDACGLTATCVQTIQIDDRTNPVITCPADVTAECDAVLDPATNPSLGRATATDNCSDVAGITIDYVDNTDGLTLCGGNAGQIQRTWTATDECGNSTSCVQIITIEDNTPPTLDCSGLSNPTVDCTADLDPANNPTLGTPTFTDNCSDNANVTLVYNDDNSGLTECGGIAGTIIRTWTATDECGNSATCSQTITIADNEAPVITCPEMLEVSCTDVTDPSATGMPTATDNCDPNPELTFVDSGAPTGDGCEGIAGAITRTWTATDACGNMATCTQIITIVDNEAPVITCPTNAVTVECDEDLDPANNPNLGQPTATDDCTPTTEIALTFVDDNSGLTECNGIAGTIIRTWTATDLCGNTATCQQTINVEDTTAPTLDGVPDDVTVECDAIPATPADSEITVADNCDTNVQLEFNEERINGSCNDSYTLIRTWTAIDACGNQTPGVQTIVVIDNTAPVIEGAPSGTISVNCDDAILAPPADLTATDNCDADVPVVFTEDRTDGDCIGNYTLTRTWSATDDCGNNTEIVQTINVTDTTAPVTTCEPTSEEFECTGEEGNAFAALSWNNANIQRLIDCSTDDCNNVIVTSDYDFNNLTDLCGRTGVLTVVFTIADECGNSTTKTATFTIIDTTDPSVNFDPANLTLDCEDDLTTRINEWDAQNITDLTNSIFDNCGGGNVESDLNLDNLENGCSPGTGTVTVTYTISDECGNEIIRTATLTIEDDTAPVLNCDGISTTIACGDDLVNVPVPTVTDACTPDDQITLTFEDDITNLDDCGDQGFIIRRYTATDLCGNTSTCEQTITITNEAPVLDCSAIADVTITCSENPADAPRPTVTDDCTDANDIQLDFVDNTNGLDDCGEQGTIIRTWTATDACGMTATCIQTIVITNEDPVFDCEAVANIEVTCADDLNNIPAPTATDDCTPTVETPQFVHKPLRLPTKHQS